MLVVNLSEMLSVLSKTIFGPSVKIRFCKSQHTHKLHLYYFWTRPGVCGANFMKFKFERGLEQFLCLVVFTFQEESDAKLVIIRIDRCLKLGLANT